jgi:Adenylylsulfate kinase and related kinases
MAKGNIYWLTGQPAHGKTVLGKMLVELLQTEKRNWRKDVFHVDGDDLRALTINKDYTEQGRINNIRRAQLLAEYLSSKGCDVVVSLVAPYEWLRQEFKERSV